MIPIILGLRYTQHMHAVVSGPYLDTSLQNEYLGMEKRVEVKQMNLCVTTAHTLPHRVTSSNPVLSDCMPTPPFECKPTVRSTSETHPGGLLRSCSAAAEPSSSTGIGRPLLSPTCCCCRSKPLPSPPLAVVLLPQSLISLSSCSSSSSDLPFVSGRTRIAKSVATAYSQPASQSARQSASQAASEQARQAGHP